MSSSIGSYEDITPNDIQAIANYFEKGEGADVVEEGKGNTDEESQKKPWISGKKVTPAVLSAMQKTRESINLWKEGIPEIKWHFQNAGGDEKSLGYISSNKYHNTKIYFYYLLETLHLHRFINIRLRDRVDNHPLEFVILDKENCIGKFDIFFVKNRDNLFHNPEELLKPKDEFSNMKCTADKLWRVDLSWLITSDSAIPEINAAMQPSLKAIPKSTIDKVKGKFFFPYPFCFTDVDAPLRVFKLIILPSNVDRHIGSLVTTTIYKSQLELMKKFRPHIFEDGPPIDALAQGVIAFDRQQRAQSESEIPPEPKRKYSEIISGGRKSNDDLFKRILELNKQQRAKTASQDSMPRYSDILSERGRSDVSQQQGAQTTSQNPPASMRRYSDIFS